ncbi:MAG: Ig-like domain-containing protein, partial [Saprospiraceae bacterium]
MRFILILVCLLTLRTFTSAQTIPTPTQTDAIIIDLGTPGSADPGDRIRYTVTVQNTGGPAATLTQLNAVLDAKTTLVAGSFKTSPLAINDAYTVTGNVGITVNAASGMRANDFDDNIPLLTQAVGTFATTGSGSITVAADGSFTYTPAAGFTGSDTYTYTLTDGDPVGLPVPLTDMGTVTFTVSNMIWFIDNSVAGPGTGTLSDPFKTIASFNASAAAAGHVVFLKNTGTNYTNGIVLKNNQLFFGTGTSGGSTLTDVLPFGLAPNSPALPAIGGTRPIIAPSANDGILLASGNTVRGVEVGAVTGTGAKIKGTNFGTLTLGNTTTPDVALNGNGQALNLTTGTFAATSKFVSVATTSSSGQGIIFTGVAGTVAFGSTSVSGATTQGILIGTSTAVIDFGNTTVTSTTDGVSFQNNASGTKTFGTLTITGGSGVGFLHGAGGGPVTVTGATSITNPAGAGIDIQNSASAVTFAGTTVNKGASAGTGVNLGGAASGNSGNTTFNSLAITTSTGAGLVGLNNTGTTTVTTNAGSISAAGGPAINFNRTSGGNTPVSLNFSNVGTTSSTTNGVAFTNVSGTYVATGGTLTGCTGTAFLVSAG